MKSNLNPNRHPYDNQSILTQTAPLADVPRVSTPNLYELEKYTSIIITQLNVPHYGVKMQRYVTIIIGNDYKLSHCFA